MGKESLSEDNPYPEDEILIERLKQILSGDGTSIEEALAEYYRNADERHYRGGGN